MMSCLLIILLSMAGEIWRLAQEFSWKSELGQRLFQLQLHDYHSGTNHIKRVRHFIGLLARYRSRVPALSNVTLRIVPGCP